MCVRVSYVYIERKIMEKKTENQFSYIPNLINEYSVKKY
jgi:hypothetical protein